MAEIGKGLSYHRVQVAELWDHGSRALWNCGLMGGLGITELWNYGIMGYWDKGVMKLGIMELQGHGAIKVGKGLKTMKYKF